MRAAGTGIALAANATRAKSAKEKRQRLAAQLGRRKKMRALTKCFNYYRDWFLLLDSFRLLPVSCAPHFRCMCAAELPSLGQCLASPPAQLLLLLRRAPLVWRKGTTLFLLPFDWRIPRNFSRTKDGQLEVPLHSLFADSATWSGHCTHLSDASHSVHLLNVCARFSPLYRAVDHKQCYAAERSIQDTGTSQWQ